MSLFIVRNVTSQNRTYSAQIVSIFYNICLLISESGLEVHRARLSKQKRIWNQLLSVIQPGQTTTQREVFRKDPGWILLRAVAIVTYSNIDPVILGAKLQTIQALLSNIDQLQNNIFCYTRSQEYSKIVPMRYRLIDSIMTKWMPYGTVGTVKDEGEKRITIMSIHIMETSVRLQFMVCCE